jgi:hypothetical protein
VTSSEIYRQGFAEGAVIASLVWIVASLAIACCIRVVRERRRDRKSMFQVARRKLIDGWRYETKQRGPAPVVDIRGPRGAA